MRARVQVTLYEARGEYQLVLDHMEPEAMSELWHTPMGWGVLAVVAFMEIMGLYIIRKIVLIDV